MSGDAEGIDFPELIQWLDHYVVSLDLKTRRFLFVSAGAAGRLGESATAVELRGPTLQRFLERFFPDPDTRGRVARLIEGDLSEPTFEYYTRDSGALRWRRATVRIVKGPDGTPARLDLVSADITDLVESRRATARSDALRRIGERIYGAKSVAEAVDIVCSEVRLTLGTARAALFLFDEASGAISAAGTSRVAGSVAVPPSATRERMTAPHAVYGRVAQFLDIRTAPDLPQFDQLVAAGIRSLATAAIGNGERPLGLLVVSTIDVERVFDADEMRLLEDVANLIAGPLARAALEEEKTRAAAVIAAAEERMQAGLDATTTGIWEFDLSRNAETWDARCFDLWEMDPEKGPMSFEVHRRIHPEDQIAMNDALARALDPATNGELSIEYRYLAPSGAQRWLAARGRCFFTPERLPRRFIGTVVDVTERHRAEAEQLATERRYRDIVETMTEGVGVLQTDGRLKFVNRAYVSIFGFESEEAMVGLHAEDLMFPEDRAAARERWAAHDTAAGDGAMRGVRRFRAKQGHEVWLSVASVPIREEGVLAGVLSVSTDVTSARRLEMKLQQAQKLESLGVLAGGIAHDFNNLLVGMLGNAGLARAELPPESKVHGAIASIEVAALRASELTRQLLAYAGKGRFVVDRIDLKRLVEEMGHLLSTVIGKGVTLGYRFGEGVPAIEGDATQLRQVVMNLITNASDAIGEGSGVVTLTTSVVERDAAPLADALLDDGLAAGTYVCFEVADTGAGMSPETRARIFDPFFTTKFTGRGLGLAAVLGIVRAHHGAIEVTSEVGRGTTFRMLLPASTSTAESLRPVTPRSIAEEERGTILVVDDEEMVRKVTTRILVKAGYEVLTAEDGVQAIATFRERQGEIRAVILDLTMPRMGGEETFHRLRELDPHVRVLLSSGYSEQEMTSLFRGGGVAGFIEKPFSFEKLVEKLRAALGDLPQAR